MESIKKIKLESPTGGQAAFWYLCPCGDLHMTLKDAANCAKCRKLARRGY